MNIAKQNQRRGDFPVIPPFCGESEIRTREPLWEVTRFPGVPLQPLEHLSNVLPFGLQDCKYRNISLNQKIFLLHLCRFRSGPATRYPF